MMALTHGVIGMVAYAGAVVLSGGQPHPAGLAAAAVGGWLPDIDTTTSTVGRCFFPLAAWIERRFGHRSLTHSLAGLTLFAALASPLLLSPVARFLFAPLLIGYGSHLLADAATKAGVPLLWPGRARFVFPGNEALRFQTGSAAELVLLLVFVLLGAMSVPVARLGPRPLLHGLTRDVPGALRDVEDYSEAWHCEAEVEGYELLSQRLIQGRFPVLGRRGDGALVIERAGALWLLNGSGGGQEPYRIEPRRVRIHRVRPRRDQVVQVDVANLTLGALARQLEEAARPGKVTVTSPPAVRHAGQVLPGTVAAWSRQEVRITGVVECYALPGGPSAPVAVPRTGIKTVQFDGRLARLEFATPAHLAAAGAKVAIRDGTLSVTLPRDVPVAPLVSSLSLPLKRVVMSAQQMRRHADLLVSPGDLVRGGQVLQRTFAQASLADDEGEAEARVARRRAREELRALEVEERALRNTALWPELASGFAQRRAALQKQASATPTPTPGSLPLPVPQTAPFDAVVESVVWEPPTIPTRRGEVAEHRAQVSLVQVKP